ncbi:hypothetical protein [Streptomyces olivochromogenes]|uniref:hypothetical protein n=1 Tax=Streptomyces olivochromogenes TaxID=1963 RepID=UPI001F1F0A72|nr:hypothetical protein [Streptomyces olivochromogenes]MCF3136077.1 hypothetical protein [Streptomyces olivochromogenes]
MSEEDRELGPGEYRARAGIIRKMVPGEVLASVPAARELAESEGRRLQFDFLDDAAVLKLLHLRYLDQEKMRSGGMRLGLPSAFVLMGLFVYWGAYVQYWESSKSQSAYYAAAGAVVGVIVLLYVVSLRRHWGDRPRQKVRARSAAYREIAHAAARQGAELPEFYPHYGPYPFAANFYADAADLELPSEAGER